MIFAHEILQNILQQQKTFNLKSQTKWQNFFWKYERLSTGGIFVLKPGQDGCFYSFETFLFNIFYWFLKVCWEIFANVSATHLFVTWNITNRSILTKAPKRGVFYLQSTSYFHDWAWEWFHPSHLSRDSESKLIG